MKDLSPSSSAIRRMLDGWQTLGDLRGDLSLERVAMLRRALLDTVAGTLAEARGCFDPALSESWRTWREGGTDTPLAPLLAQAEAARREPSLFLVAREYVFADEEEEVLRNLATDLAALFTTGDLTETLLGDAYQILHETPFRRSDGRKALRQHRNRQGCFYTPATAVRHLLDMVFADRSPGRVPTVCDPAMGCGHLLLAAARRLVDEGVSPADALGALHGADIDAEAVRLARITLWLAFGLPVPDRFRVGDALTGPGWKIEGLFALMDGIDWGRAFPACAAAGGFDAILSNPPFDVLTSFAVHPERKAYAARLRTSETFPLAAQGQINLYRLFLERILGLARRGGRYAVVLPGSFLTDETATALRVWALTEHHLDTVAHFPESARVFEGVGQSIAIVAGTAGGGAAPAIHIALPNTPAVAVDRHIFRTLAETSLPIPPDVARWTNALAWLESIETTRFDMLADGFVGEADQTVFKACFRDDAGEVLVRGAHVSPFAVDRAPVPGAARFLDGERFRAQHGPDAPALERAMHERVVQLGIRNMETRPRLVAGIIPGGIWCGNSVNVWLPRQGVGTVFVAALLNSALYDWRFRLTSSNNNINVYEIRVLPLPRAVADFFAAPPRSRGRVAAVAKRVRAVETACRGCIRTPESTSWRHRLDDAVFDLFDCPEPLRRRIADDAWGMD